MRKLTLWVLPFIALSVLFACAESGIKGNGKLSHQDRQVKAFNSVDIRGNYNVMITAGKPQKLAVTADTNLQSYILTEISNNTLIIHTKNNVKLIADNPPVITIRLPKLEKILASGAVRLQATNIATDKLSIMSAGASNLLLKGMTNELYINTSGAAKVNGVGLVANHVKIEVSGAGNVDVHALKTLIVKVSGAGKIRYAGNPEVSQTISGMGSINQMP